MAEQSKRRLRLRLRWVLLAVLVVALSPRALRGCGEDLPLEPGGEFLVIVESALVEPLAASLDQYAYDVQSEGVEVHIQPWEPGTVEELRELIFMYVDDHGIEGALLVGELPAAWYEQTAFNHDEDFPIDLYLQDRDGIWFDEDNNGRFDRHSTLGLEIYTARLHGTAEELVDYFARVHAYRHGGPLVDVSAFIFIDDDWVKASTEDALRLREAYSNVDICKELYESTAEVYLGKMTGDGAEFVYQAMHASPRLVQFEHVPEGGQLTYTLVKGEEICELNLKGSFYNLFNCSAARFTEENRERLPDYLARDYIVGTDYGLAAIGSTKTGAVTRPRTFHGHLAAGRRWGQAYREWFNREGFKNDEWHLGIVLIGDPLLRLTGDRVPSALMELREMTPPSEVEGIERIMERIAEEADLGTYEEYRAGNPQFFN